MAVDNIDNYHVLRPLNFPDEVMEQHEMVVVNVIVEF